MKKMKSFWASLDDVTCISKRELFLGILACTLAGIVFGLLFSPKKTTIIGSNNGNRLAGCVDEDAILEEEDGRA